MAKKKELSKAEKLGTILEGINKIFKDTAQTTLGKDVKYDDVNSFSSRSLTLNHLIGIDGYPIGHHIEIFGKESAGKTLFSLMAIAEVQSQGGIAAFVDAEHAYDKEWAKWLGVNDDELVKVQPEFIEKGLDIMASLAPACDLIVFDSVGGSNTKKEWEGTAQDEDMGIKPRRMSRMVPKLTTLSAKHKCSIIWLNQIREKIGISFPGQSNERTPGGNALKHHCVLRLDVRRSRQIKQQEERIGHFIKVTVAKNKMAGTQFQSAEIPFLLGEGIVREHEILHLGEELGVIQKGGAWYKYKETSLEMGLVKTIQFLKDNPELTNTLEDEIRTKLKS